MPNFFRNRLFIIIAVTVLLIIVMGISSTFSSTLNRVGNIVNIPLAPVQTFLSYVGEKFDSTVTFFQDTRAVREENERLKKEVMELKKENRELKNYRKKNEELRKALKLKERFADYEFIGANVIAKDPGNWFVVFRIDLGSRDGVVENVPVISSENGLVGRVTHPNLTSSKVLAIIDEDSVVDGWISKDTGEGGSVIVRGDIRLKDSGLCRMDYIPVDLQIEAGDVVETSGLGGIYPKGIIIGIIKEVLNPDSEFKRYAIVEPAVNFKNLEEVFVLREKTYQAGSDDDEN